MRIIAFSAWFTDGRYWQFDCANDEQFIGQWASLPDDGALAFKLFYDVCSGPVRYKRNVSGDEWYYAALLKAGAMVDHCSNSSREAIAERYPGAVIIRGKATSEDEMHRVSVAQAELQYWRDPLPIPRAEGCCGD